MSTLQAIFGKLPGRSLVRAIDRGLGWLERRSKKWTSYLVVADHGARLLNCGTQAVVWELRWTDVVEIFAWKQDCFTVDLICMEFHTRADAAHIYLCHEQQEGWQELCRGVELRFGIDPGWWSAVAFPPFAENRRLLWRDPDVDLPYSAR